MRFRYLPTVDAFVLVDIAGIDVALHFLAIRKAGQVGWATVPPISPLPFGGH